MFVAHVEISDLSIRKARAEILGLLVHIQDQLRTVDSFWKAWEIFDESRGRQLAARLAPFQNERAQVRSCGINRGSQSGATAPNNDYSFHISI